MQTPQGDAACIATGAVGPANAVPQVEEQVAEFRRKAAYAFQHFIMWKRVLEDKADFNASLRELRAVLKRERPVVLQKLHLELQCAVTYLAREHATANGRSGPLSASDLEAGARDAVSRLKAKRGRPAFRVLRHHVEGLMALFEETVRVPARATRDKDSVYDPQAINWSGQFIVNQLTRVDPSVTEVTIARMIVDAQKRYARKAMRFAAYFPGYGVTMTPF